MRDLGLHTLASALLAVDTASYNNLTPERALAVVAAGLFDLRALGDWQRTAAGYA